MEPSERADKLSEYLVDFMKSAIKAPYKDPIIIAKDSLLEMLLKVRNTLKCIKTQLVLINGIFLGFMILRNRILRTSLRANE